MSSQAEAGALATRRGRFAVAVRALFPAGGWLATVHLLIGLPINALAFAYVVTMASLTIGSAPTVIGALGAAAAGLWGVRGLTALQRSRLRGLLGLEIPAVDRRSDGSWLRALVADVARPSTWQQITYHLLALPVSIVGFCAILLIWSYGLAMSAIFAYEPSLPSQGVFDLSMHDPRILILLSVCGLVLLAAAPRVALALAKVDAMLARALLGPSRSESLAARMRMLEHSRAEVVDAADAERRRIERDLHDGAQQRLVSLAMNLGMARAQLGDQAGPAHTAIAQAHEEAKQALVELRDLVRGLHPAVLDDRGLDAALSGIASRAALPVRLQVDVAPRCSPTVEAIAYFIVSESLTNVAKHAHATSVDVDVVRNGDRLSIRVTDDGRGGASRVAGGGLAGLAQRASSVDGSLHVDSPPGGPTVIEVELPCAS